MYKNNLFLDQPRASNARVMRDQRYHDRHEQSGKIAACCALACLAIVLYCAF